VGWRDEERARQERTVAAVEGLREEIAEGVRALRATPPPEPPPDRDLERLPGLQLALRFCRDIDRGEALVQMFRRVPESRVQRELGKVRCHCKAEHPFSAMLEQASCGRWFIGDESGVWALRFDEPVADAA
jgi:hypothetical protein